MGKKPKVKSQEVDSATLMSVVGMDSVNECDKLNDITTASFLVRVSSKTTSNSAVKINVDCKRTDKGDTIADCIKDLWMNSKYGMNESLEFLEIREQLSEKIGILLDTKETAFTQISNILKSFGYLFYPALTRFIIRKDEPQHYNKYVFTSKNTSKISFSYQIKDKFEESRGILGKYLKQGEVTFSEIEYPENMNSYDEVILYGVTDFNTAQKAVRRFYTKMANVIKTCTIETSMLGIIPELNDRVGVMSEYIDGNIAVGLKEIKNNTLTFNQSVDFKQGKTYFCQVVDLKTNDHTGIFEIENQNNFTDMISLKLNGSQIGVEITPSTIALIGDKVELLDSYIIKDMSVSELTFGTEKPVNVTLSLQEYRE